MTFSADKYPITAKYLESVPNGLDSYPECLARTDARENIRLEYSEIGQDTELPPIIADFFAGRYKKSWIPEVVSNALLLCVRDSIFQTDEDLLAWSYQGHSRLYLKPHYRVMIYILSPALLISGATNRWSSFHRGTTLTPKPIKREGGFYQGSASLTFPPRLYNELILRVQRGAYQAAVDATKAKESRVLLTEMTDTHALISFRWSATG
ncbi:MAG: hypothetical protein JXA30_02640 [Deltaproteobacteria bacterium]|nr:hypothetical protein [Deltaproteobacteria bacterium]